MTPVLCFDIETVPDVAALRRLRPEWNDLDDGEVAARAFAERRERIGSEFLQHHLHRIVAIGCAFRDDGGFRVRCLGEENDPETRLVQDFYRVIDKYTPQLVSWNGGGFDLPVLHYRALVHGVHAVRYWDLGDDDRDFRFNNYVNRYHTRHLDLMDVLSMYQPRASAPLDDIARLAGFPGKIGMDGARVWDAFREGKLGTIRRYCETDVVNTYLVFCRFQKMRGSIDDAAYRAEMRLVRDTLSSLGADPWQRFLDAWPEE